MQRPLLQNRLGLACVSPSAEAAKVHPTVRVASLDDWKMVKEKARLFEALRGSFREASLPRKAAAFLLMLI